MDGSLPFIKREGLGAITRKYPDKKRGRELIATRIENFYSMNYPEISMENSLEIEHSIHALQAIYHRNIHTGMEIEWGSYPDNLGHRQGPGCFRCHNPYMVDSEGISISNDCTLCHSILAYEENEPFKYLFPIDDKEIESKMQQYLQDEFIKSY